MAEDANTEEQPDPIVDLDARALRVRVEHLDDEVGERDGPDSLALRIDDGDGETSIRITFGADGSRELAWIGLERLADEARRLAGVWRLRGAPGAGAHGPVNVP